MVNNQKEENKENNILNKEEGLKNHHIKSQFNRIQTLKSFGTVKKIIFKSKE